VPSVTQRYRLNSDEIAAETIGGESVILNLSSGDYFSLNGAGGLAWALLVRGHSATEIAPRIAGHFGVGEERAQADLDALVTGLVEQELLIADDSAQPSEPAEDELPPEGEYAAPSLEVFTDMSELLALDPPMPGIKEVPWRAPAE
jgi:Coenzyme PQQ synthesis protein D (PqqD)